jgi:hypothetical protein
LIPACILSAALLWVFAHEAVAILARWGDLVGSLADRFSRAAERLPKAIEDALPLLLRRRLHLPSLPAVALKEGLEHQRAAAH